MLKLMLKGVLLLSMVATGQVWITHQSGTHLAAHFDAILQGEPDVFFFGDSTIGCCDPLDTDRRPTTTMLDTALDQRSIGAFANPAYHAEIYELFFNRLLAGNYRPQLVVVPVNLRSMSPIWDCDPAAQVETVQQTLEFEKSVWRRAFAPLARTLGAGLTPAITRQEYMNQPVYRGEAIVGRVSDFRNGSVDQQLVLNYMYSLNERHRKVAALRRIAVAAEVRNLPVLFYVTPVDYQSATDELRHALVAQISQNVDTLRSTLAGSGAEFLDLSLELGSQGFTYDRRVNEHLKSQGRILVSQRLAEQIR